MNKRMTTRTVSATAAGLLIASMALVGCDRRDNTVAANNGIPPTESTSAGPGATTPLGATNPPAGEDRAREPQADASRSMDKGQANATEAGRDMKDAAKSTADNVGNKVDDARITTSVNAELAKDSSLSAVKINVDTDGGRVALKGSAPSESARERATVLASNVSGVVSVDNQLTIDRKM
jgi:hyperosmotically inducible protein